VFTYTRDSIKAFRKAGVMPDMVQVGNEVTAGMMWPDSRLPAQWQNFADLLLAGIHGVDKGRGWSRRPLIMIHIDKGGNKETTKWSSITWRNITCRLTYSGSLSTRGGTAVSMT